VPFCARKCEYCAFYSEASDLETIHRYVTALSREMERVAERLKPRTIFFGGGTPSLLSVRQWEQVLRAMDRLGLLGAAEWTVECNPATVSEEKARLLRDHGVNRLSLGVQSLDEALLDRLGRIHSREQVFKSFDLLRKAGFDNLNVDLMFAIPGQTMALWQATLREALALGSEHLSSYEVIYEEDTPLFQQLNAGEFDVDEDLACAMYEELVQQAMHAGFRQYEIANFARDFRCGTSGSTSAQPLGEFPALACRHNINYWRGGDFFGLGPSATTYVRGVRTKNLSNTRLYCERLEAGERPPGFREELSPLGRAGETAAFGLRTSAGWPFDEFTRVTGFDLRTEWATEMRELVERGHAVWDESRFRLTARGLRFADTAAEMFLRSGDDLTASAGKSPPQP
jgi:oxygen-independent coproporphyrinogen-3 oxidase